MTAIVRISDIAASALEGHPIYVRWVRTAAGTLKAEALVMNEGSYCIDPRSEAALLMLLEVVPVGLLPFLAKTIEQKRCGGGKKKRRADDRGSAQFIAGLLKDESLSLVKDESCPANEQEDGDDAD